VRRNFHPLIIILSTLVAACSILLTACGSGEDTPSAGDTGSNAQLGEQLYIANCSACHSTQKDTVLVGPSLAGLGERAGDTIPGLSAEAYILQSINEPDAYLNEGYPNVMPDAYNQMLSEEEMNALVSFLLSLE